MTDAFRAMLDELMGKERDAPLHERSNRKVVFSDADVCKYELVSVCPHQLFKNTKSDLGARGVAGAGRRVGGRSGRLASHGVASGAARDPHAPCGRPLRATPAPQAPAGSLYTRTT
jgi:hypothetical protein